jgi:redox-sensitive bicupin YhaK (pirin superfamily)
MTRASSDLKLDQVILPSVRDLGGGFEVRRALPSAQRQMVGPFIFLTALALRFFAGTRISTSGRTHILASQL